MHGSDPMHANERDPYLNALGRIVSAIEDARLELMKTAQRI